MSVKSISGIVAWTGITFSLFSVLAETDNGFFSPCDSLWLIAIAFASGLLVSVSGDKRLKPWVSLILTITGSALLFMNIPFLVPLSLFLLITGFNPLARFPIYSKVAGLLAAIFFVLGKKLVSWDFHIDAVILAAISVLWFLTGLTGSKPSADSIQDDTGFVKSHRAEKGVRILLDAFLLLVLVVVVQLESQFYFSGMITGLIFFLVVSNYLTKQNRNLTLSTRYLTLFFTLFLLTLLTGFLSRAYGWWLEVACVCIAVCFSVIYVILNKNHQMTGIHTGNRTAPTHHKKWVNLVALVFLAAHFPACLYWLDRLAEVSMPEPFIPLALHQYFIKNLVLIPAAATFLAGFLFLRRRSLE